MNTTGERLRVLREEKGLTQEGLATTLNVARQTISYYESGKRFPDSDFVIALCKYFGCSADFVLGIDDQKTTPRDALSRNHVWGVTAPCSHAFCTDIPDFLTWLKGFSTPRESRNYFIRVYTDGEMWLEECDDGGGAMICKLWALDTCPICGKAYSIKGVTT